MAMFAYIRSKFDGSELLELENETLEFKCLEKRNCLMVQVLGYKWPLVVDAAP